MHGIEWDFGLRIEAVVRTWYQNQGWFVIPISLIEMGGAPRAVGLIQAHVLPDLQVARAGTSRWVEVKGKGRICRYEKAGEFRTGIEDRLWRAYLHVEKESGIPGYLAMVHLRRVPDGVIDPLLLLAPFAILDPPDQDRVVHEAFNFKEMIFWNVDRFDRYDLPRHDVSDIPSLEPRTIHPWETKRELKSKQPTQGRLLLP